MADTIFPAFLTLKTRRDPRSEGEFISAVDTVLWGTKRRVSDFSKETQGLLSDALPVKRNLSGSLDLVRPQFREAAKAQHARAVAAREVANAISLTAREERIHGQAMREQIVAARQLAEAEEREAAVLRSKITVLDQVQERLNRQPSAIRAVAGVNSNLAIHGKQA